MNAIGEQKQIFTVKVQICLKTRFWKMISEYFFRLIHLYIAVGPVLLSRILFNPFDGYYTSTVYLVCVYGIEYILPYRSKLCKATYNNNTRLSSDKKFKKRTRERPAFINEHFMYKDNNNYNDRR